MGYGIYGTVLLVIFALVYRVSKIKPNKDFTLKIIVSVLGWLAPSFVVGFVLYHQHTLSLSLLYL